MNKTKIEWCDRTWNPVTGCLHGCEYCYARNQARRFSGCYDPVSDENIKQNENGIVSLEHSGRMFYKTKTGEKILAPYPFGFAPTFHGYRLNEPEEEKKPQNIFVCSMADLFGKWVPDKWIEAVFGACGKARQHRYLFLTKNPLRLPSSSHIYTKVFERHFDNYWFGKTVTTQKSLEADYRHYSKVNGNTFLNIEPLHGEVNLSHIDTGDVTYDITKSMAYYLGGGRKVQSIKWVIIGAESGNRKDKIVPKCEWIETIVKQCGEADIPIFMKDSLADTWRKPLIRQFPWR